MSQAADNATPLEEQLVAYLDGELDEAEARRVEQLLATDPTARRTLHQLERAWQLLDELDSSQTPPEFTRSTLQMVTVEAERQWERGRWWRVLRVWGVRLGFGVVLLAAAAAGFVCVALFAEDENRQLLEDLPLLENLPEYRQIDSLQLLRRLHGEGVFAGREVSAGQKPGQPGAEQAAVESEVAAAGKTGGEDSLAERRRRIKAMSYEQQEQLRHRREQFASLAAGEQQRLRRLHEALQADPQRAELEMVMHRYCRWLEEQPAYRRAELEELDIDQRVARIKQLREAELAQQARRASREDLAGLSRWMHEHAARQETRLLQALPPDRRRQLEKLSPAVRRGMMLWLMWQRWRVFRPGGPPPLDEQQLAELRVHLSTQTAERLAQMSPSEQWQTVAGWIREEVRRRFYSRGHSNLVPAVDDEALARFFENELTDEQRDRLLNLPGEEMQRELQRMYLMSLRLVEPGILFPKGKRPGGPPGFSPPGGHYPHRPPHGFRGQQKPPQDSSGHSGPGKRGDRPGVLPEGLPGPSRQPMLGPPGPARKDLPKLPPGSPSGLSPGPRPGMRPGNRPPGLEHSPLGVSPDTESSG